MPRRMKIVSLLIMVFSPFLIPWTCSGQVNYRDKDSHHFKYFSLLPVYGYLAVCAHAQRLIWELFTTSKKALRIQRILILCSSHTPLSFQNNLETRTNGQRPQDRLMETAARYNVQVSNKYRRIHILNGIESGKRFSQQILTANRPVLFRLRHNLFRATQGLHRSNEGWFEKPELEWLPVSVCTI